MAPTDYARMLGDKSKRTAGRLLINTG